MVDFDVVAIPDLCEHLGDFLADFGQPRPNRWNDEHFVKSILAQRLSLRKKINTLDRWGVFVVKSTAAIANLQTYIFGI